MLLRYEERFTDYGRDESRRTGTFEWIAFPETVDDLRAALRQARERHLPVTVQGARTGIAGGAVPEGGCVLSLEKMNRIVAAGLGADGNVRLRVQPGLSLDGLRRALAGDRAPEVPSRDVPGGEMLRSGGEWVFTPDPTEPSASLGGMAACNASGARSFVYGPMRRHVHALRVVLSDGDTLRLERGRERAHGLDFCLTTESGRILRGTLPRYAFPGVKNATGYYARPDMDLVDLFIGSEGTLGIIAELELILRPAPPAVAAVVCFPPDEDTAVRLAERFRAERDPRPAALEYFDAGALALLRRQHADSGGAIPLPDPEAHCALYVEYQGENESVEAGILALSDVFAEFGIDEARTWMADDPTGLRRFKDFRHAVPETVNQVVDRRRREHPGLTKLGTDFSVPPGALPDLLRRYRSDLARVGLEYVLFGHIGDSHLHLNILPRNPREYRTGRELYEQWADWVVSRGGSVSAEHGIGKLKTVLLRKMYGDEGVAAMRAVKSVFDPEFLLNPGALFGE